MTLLLLPAYTARMNTKHYDPEKLKRHRELEGLTQEQVATRLNVHRQTIYRAESGIAASYELLCSMCELYNAPVLSVLRSRPLEIAA